jgi:hypothetical protein
VTGRSQKHLTGFRRARLGTAGRRSAIRVESRCLEGHTDGVGIATVSLTLIPEITRLVKSSLACFVAHPFGLTLGDIGDDDTHGAVIEAMLRPATVRYLAGTILDLGYRWLRDDLRQRQLASYEHLVFAKIVL